MIKLANPDDLNRSRIHTQNIIKEVVDNTMKQVQPDADETLMIKKINSLAIECFQQFSGMHDLNVIPMTKEEAMLHIARLYKEKLRLWSQDELVTAFSLVQATLGVEAFRERLI